MANFMNMLGNLAHTENGALAHKGSGDPLVDFFYQVSDASATLDRAGLEALLAAAWDRDALCALKLVFHLLDVREGKMCNALARPCLLWVYQKQPTVLLGNLRHVPFFGSYKDLLQLLADQSEVFVERKAAADAENAKYHGKRKRSATTHTRRPPGPTTEYKTDPNRFPALYKDIRETVDPQLHEHVAELFVAQFREDLAASSPSLAAKWFPGEGKSLDAQTGIFSLVAQRMFPGNSAATQFRQQVLSPLRKKLKIAERAMSAGAWSELEYGKVPSVCMKRNARNFSKHDGDRFKAYLDDVTAGKAEIKAAVLKPHELMAELFSPQPDSPETAERLQLIEAQWKAIVKTAKGKGNLENCLAVVDVSGSMFGTPMEVAIALGLLIAECAVEPWRNSVVTFSMDPEIFSFAEGESLCERVAKIREMPWGMNTDFVKVFRLILQRAVATRLPAAEMVKTVFVLSDMQFDDACGQGHYGETTHELLQREFANKGYKLPRMVYWNLRTAGTTPVEENTAGAALLAGFSPKMLSLFVEEEATDALANLTPRALMMLAIGAERYGRVTISQ